MPSMDSTTTIADSVLGLSREHHNQASDMDGALSSGGTFSADRSWDLISQSAPEDAPERALHPINAQEKAQYSNLQHEIDSGHLSTWMVKLGNSLTLSGPKLISRERYERCKLGSGSEFEVFGHNDTQLREHLLGQTLQWEGFLAKDIVFKRGRVALERSADLGDESSYWMGDRSSGTIAGTPSRKIKERDQHRVMSIIREMRMLAHPKIRSHPNIVRLLAWGMDQEALNEKSLVTPILVQERALGTLATFLDSHDLGVLERFNLCVDILSGLSHLHSLGFFHGDINPKNVLIFNKIGETGYVAKIADFSHSGQFPTSSDDGIWYKGTAGWQAPEIETATLDSRESVLALESFSFGLLVWSMFATKGQPPMSLKQTSTSHISKIATRSLELCHLPTSIRSKMLDVVAGLLNSSPLERPALSPGILGEHITVRSNRQYGKGLVNVPTDLAQSLLAVPFDALDLSLGDGAAESADPNRRSAVEQNVLQQALFDMTYEATGKFDELGLGNMGEWRIPTYTGRSDKDMKVSSHRHDQSTIIHPVGLDSMAKLEVSPMNTFDMAISFYSYDKNQSLNYLQKSAMIGDVRAQALCQSLCEAHGQSISNNDLPADVAQQWLLNGSFTGSLFALSALGKRYPESLAMAKAFFQGKGGYNSQLCQNEPVDGPVSLDNFADFETDEAEIEKYVDAPIIMYHGENRETIFHRTVLAGNLENLTRLIEAYEKTGRWTVNGQNAKGETPLYLACASGQFEMAMLLLRNGACAYHGDTLGVTPLHWLFSFADDEITTVCQSLVSVGAAKVNANALETESIHFPFQWPAGNALTWAVFTGSICAVRALGDAIVVRHEQGEVFSSNLFETAVQLASSNYDAEMMDELLRIATKIGMHIEDFLMKAFNWEISKVSNGAGEFEVTAMPLKGDWRQDMIHRLRYGSNSAIQTARRDLLRCVMTYRSSKITDDDAETINGGDPMGHIIYLTKAISQGDSETALHLIQKHGSQYSKDDMGRALYDNIVSNWSHPTSDDFPVFMDIFRALIAAGANVNAIHENSIGNSLFHVIIRKYADHRNDSELAGVRQLCLLLLKVLISCGVKVNALNMVHLTPLDYALHNVRDWNVDNELVRLLLKEGCRRTSIYGHCATFFLEGPDDGAQTVDRRVEHGSSHKSLLWQEMDEAVF